MQLIFTRFAGPTATKPAGIVATHTGKATFVRTSVSGATMADHVYAASLLGTKLKWRGRYVHVGTDDKGREVWANVEGTQAFAPAYFNL